VYFRIFLSYDKLEHSAAFQGVAHFTIAGSKVEPGDLISDTSVIFETERL
jgi:hypothetical protein